MTFKNFSVARWMLILMKILIEGSRAKCNYGMLSGHACSLCCEMACVRLTAPPVEKVLL